MKKQTYTIDQIQNELNLTPTLIGTLMKRYGFTYEIIFGRKHYPRQGFLFLKEMFKNRVEVVEVPKYIEVSYHIYESKMNN